MYPTIRFRLRKGGHHVTQRLYCYIRLNGRLASPFFTNIECIYKFDNKKQTFTESKEEIGTLNEHVTKICSDIRKVYNKLEAIDNEFTAQMPRDKFLSDKRDRLIEFLLHLTVLLSILNTVEKMKILKKVRWKKPDIRNDIF